MNSSATVDASGNIVAYSGISLRGSINFGGAACALFFSDIT
jgi:hypothetical protein